MTTDCVCVIFAGCGGMGLPMARCLQVAGMPVQGFGVRPPQAFGDFTSRMTDEAASINPYN